MSHTDSCWSGTSEEDPDIGCSLCQDRVLSWMVNGEEEIRRVGKEGSPKRSTANRKVNHDHSGSTREKTWGFEERLEPRFGFKL